MTSHIDEYEARNQTPHFVYTAWDANRRPLYVGCTNDVARRLREHASRSAWYPHAAAFSRVKFPTLREAESAEGHYIRKLRPSGNVHGNPRFLSVWAATANEVAWEQYDAQIAYEERVA